MLSPTSVVIPKLLHAHASIRAMPPQSGRGFNLSPEAHARPRLLAATEEEEEEYDEESEAEEAMTITR